LYYGESLPLIAKHSAIAVNYVHSVGKASRQRNAVYCSRDISSFWERTAIHSPCDLSSSYWFLRCLFCEISTNQSPNCLVYC